ncbi:carbohydrate-binding module family 32 [Aaosphaeria arxii CBS 175.79]|uniref:Carbohydrate-binding module family 32 n=1 Tax=Aaosphaeria arxii CBS 175.79 TaxID=1450172 RepID=A0A6A5XNV7_9PLEO|nr:carbohydrate-binding module family 32 [Aaosphaeria arxii CBS 175.79]KAF2014579.1 carbohydrate-binding module family 32 [Aaosphaeria arxii CBS 175.79]
MVFLRYTFVSFLLIDTIIGAYFPINRQGWTATADSFQDGNEPSKAIDGNANTFWHSRYNPDDPLPNSITIDMKQSFSVNGVSYQPRQDGSGNGRIGQHRIELSADGQSWGQPVAIGTYVNDATTKRTTFIARSARYVRITALSEAQGANNPWTSAAEINVFTEANYRSRSGWSGIWLNTVDIPIVPAAAANLPNGKVLLWSAYRIDDFGGGTGQTQTAVYDPTTGEVTQRLVTNNQHDMFCPGISMDFNGRIVVTGGNDEQKTTIYDPTSDQWVAGADMKISRGYQSTTTTSNGRVFNIGGSWSGGEGGKNGEIYDPSANQWSLVQNALVSPMLTNDRAGVYRSDNHAWLFGWKGQSVFQAGPSKAMNWYTTTGTGGVQGAGLRSTSQDAMNGNAVMYDAVAGRILTVGGAQHYQAAQATADAYNITIGNPGTTPQVAKTASMSFARGFANAVVLPDGTTFVAGGQSWVEPFTDTTAALVPELWNPATGAWTQLNPMAIPRTYHSIALLLPDATVLVGGGGLCGGCGTNHWDAETFVPPYLLNADGSRKARPVIQTVAQTVRLGASLAITTGGQVRSFSLVRLGTATHTVNTDQRRVPLTPSGSGTSYTVTIPSDAGVALPGYWFLFAIDNNGTPSIAKTIKVTT